LLDPTSPLRKLSYIVDAFKMFNTQKNTDGVLSISKPYFNPFWVGVSSDDKNRLSRIFQSHSSVVRRQDVSDFFRINGNFYIWRIDFAISMGSQWIDDGIHYGIEIPDVMGISIDTMQEMKLAELILKNPDFLINLPE